MTIFFISEDHRFVRHSHKYMYIEMQCFQHKTADESLAFAKNLDQ